MKILIVFGTRPEAIKMAPLVIEFKKHKEFETLLCVTGQHREMLDQVLTLFDIQPDFDLDIMKPNQNLYDVTANVLLGMRNVLIESNPDFVLVHGDTTTSTTTALAAFYQQILVAHVEAGLRTFNTLSPWPEEMNRQLTGRLAHIHFAPTEKAKNNLLKENISADKICVTGNTVIDALQLVVHKLETESGIENETITRVKHAGYDISRISTERKLILITGHRRENFGDGFVHLCEAIKELSFKFPQCDFLYPVHLNPNVQVPVNKILGNRKITPNIFLIEPLDYLPFIYLMNKSYLVLTDSGGIQEEAPGLGKPVLVMRDTTERPEAVDAGTVKLVGTDKTKIIEEVSLLLTDRILYDSMSKAINPYGDGLACKRIVDFMKKKE